ncbi:YCF48-related protein [Chryseolinea sp. T2]|uniref:WD40/YVTN/BNR-like repeat-containing protein n=1 Tax=Chryseolinea sp. T2 TaxID=3129255 RepID=UPI0030789645
MRAYNLKSICLQLTLWFSAFTAGAQHIEILHSDKAVSLRGLSVVTDNVIWVSGSKGTVGRSTDGGKNWEWMTVPGYEARDFRDVEAFNDKVAVIIAIATPAHILRTTDGGKTWNLTYENKGKGMFLDAMDFTTRENGIVVGDVSNGHLFIARTRDGGATWSESVEPYATADSTEGCFASSGTNIRLSKDGSYFFVTGGRKSRIVSNRAAVVLPFDDSKSSTGANSIAVAKGGRMIVVGGDFAADTVRSRNCFISNDGGSNWIMPKISPYGYRSCVEFVTGEQAIACGLNGVDVSYDAGITWRSVSNESFHACRKAKKGTAVYLSGNNGRIGKLVK